MTKLAIIDALPSISDLISKHDAAGAYAEMHDNRAYVSQKRGDGAQAEQSRGLAQFAWDEQARVRTQIKHKLDCAFGVGTGDAIEGIFSNA